MARNLFELAHQQGHLVARRNLAMMYLKGDGVQFDKARAASLLEDCLQEGHSVADFHLANMLWRGDGIPQDRGRALHLFEGGASKGVVFTVID